MKKTLLFLVFTFISTFTFCQDTKPFGIFIGLNATNATMPAGYTQDYSALKVGYSIGGVADIRLGKFLSFQPGLYYTMKGGSTEDDNVEVSIGLPNSSGTTKLIIDYIEVPFNVIFNTKGEGTTFFAGGGPYAAVKLSSVLKFNDGNETDIFGSPDLNTADIGYNIMCGVRFAKGFALRIAYGRSLTSIYREQPGMKNGGINFSAGYFFK
ncbi:MAG TPA: porin family protein [Mucilaginibacter sp.]|nr:porin family protein [Mucilaginibacter sp.]